MYMASIKVKFRPSTIEGKAGAIYYRISHNRVVRHLTSDIRLFPEHWDSLRQRVAACDGIAAGLRERIESDLARLNRIVRDFELRQVEFSAADILSHFRASGRQVSVTLFMNEQVAFLCDCNRLGTATNYRRATDTLCMFLNGRELRFSEITPRFVEQYSDYLLRRGLVRNSLSFHMRILRAVYNKAVRHGYAEQTFPFRDVYTGIDRTRKKAVSENVIASLRQLNLASGSSEALARDLFMFSFYTRGMAFVDMAYLRKSDIQEGIIRYTRHKTGRQLAVRLERCMREIIDRYADEVRGLPWIFPILDSEDPVRCYNRYKGALRLYNYRLQHLSRMLGLEYRLSSYTSRHSWATLARNHNVPVSVISAGMGHSSERTTQIYLSSLENSLIDNANRGILEAVNKSVSC